MNGMYLPLVSNLTSPVLPYIPSGTPRSGLFHRGVIIGPTQVSLMELWVSSSVVPEHG